MRHIFSEVAWECVMAALKDVLSSDDVEDENECFDQNEIANKIKSLALHDEEGNLIDDYVEFQVEIREGKVVESHTFRQIARHFYLLSGEKQKYEREISLCIRIANHLSVFFFWAEVERLKSVFRYGMQFPEDIDAISYLEHDESLVRTKNAVDRLTRLGLSPKIVLGSTDCDAIEKEMFSQLEGMVEKIGGAGVINHMLQAKHVRYSKELDRLFPIPDENGKMEGVPYQLLLIMAFKHLGDKPQFADDEMSSACEELYCLGTDWVDALDMRITNTYELLGPNLQDFPLRLSNETILNKFCVPRQYSKKFVLLMLDALLKKHFHQAEQEYGYRDYRNVIEYVLDNPLDNLDISDICRSTKLSKRRVRMILEDISVDANHINNGFKRISDLFDHDRYPVVKLRTGYCSLISCINGIGAYTLLYERIKEKFSLLDRELGIDVEEMIRGELDKKGWSYKNGKYPSKRGFKEGDCDLVIENGDRICLVEIKKRSAKKEMDSLDDVEELNRLSVGMVKAQIQCAREEEYLKTNGSLELTADKVTKVVRYDENKLIYKISVSLEEYAFLTHPAFCAELMRSILIAEYRTYDESRNDAMSMLNKYGDELREIMSRIYTVIDPDEITYRMLFCSAQQFLYAVWLSKDEKDFFDFIDHWIISIKSSTNMYTSFLERIFDEDWPNGSDSIGSDMEKRIKEWKRPVRLIRY